MNPAPVVRETTLEIEGYTLRLRGLPRADFDRLVHAHPAADDLVEPWNIGELAPALIAACAAEPELAVQEAYELYDEWPTADAEAVFEAALALCLPEPIDRAWWRLEREPRLRAELSYCGPAGVPHSHFLGGPLVWSEHDRELALAWATRRDATCSSCGTRRDQWDRDRNAFVPADDRCPGCNEIREAERQLPREAIEAGVRVVLVPSSEVEDGGGDS